MKIEVKTAFDTYAIQKKIGEGGAGRVYSAINSDGTEVALKVLTRHTEDKRKRFKNEIHFLFSKTHKNLIKVTDFGYAENGSITGPFYVMQKCDSNLREMMNRKIEFNSVLPIFACILDGVEAAHLWGATHRDLKPENILISGTSVYVSDFGIADFAEEELLTLVETKPGTRLANFQYAAPEQRKRNSEVGTEADVYALGLMLNELFTNEIPQGTDYQRIEAVAPQFKYLDQVVEQMIRQGPDKRPGSIKEVKRQIQRYEFEAVQNQKINDIDLTVVGENEVSDSLAISPPILIDVKWENGQLHMTLDKTISENWIWGLNNMMGFSSTLEAPPHSFHFQDNKAYVQVPSNRAQDVIDHFKDWLPKASYSLKHRLEIEAANKQEQDRKRLLFERKRAEETRNVNLSLKI